MDTKDSLILINCTRILMNLPAVVHDLNSGKELLLKAVQLTPNDLTVLKAVTQVIILCKRNVIKVLFFLFCPKNSIKN